MTIKFYTPIFSSSTVIDVDRFWGYFDEDIIGADTPTIAFQVNTSVNNALVELGVPYDNANIYRIKWYTAWSITLFDPAISSFFDSFPPRYKFGNITFSRTGATQTLENLTYLQQYTRAFYCYIGPVFNIGAIPPSDLPDGVQADIGFPDTFTNIFADDNLCDTFGLNLREDLVLTQYLVYSGLRVYNTSSSPPFLQKQFTLP